jgi:hypothetical protein
MSKEDGLGNVEVTHVKGPKSERPQTRPVREVLEILLERRGGINLNIQSLLLAVNTDAVANQDQERWIINMIITNAYRQAEFIAAINSFRG